MSHPQTASPAAAATDYNGLVKKYCVGCHNDRNKDRAGSLTLASFDLAKAGQHADVAERMIRKLQASMMPPPGMPRPEPAVYQSFIRALETTVDAHAKANPNPGGRTFQRLNRAEYARAIKDLLDLDVDAGNWLPLDTMSANFDNIADEQALSPTLLEAYLNAAGDISRMAVGDKNAPAIDTTYTNPTYVSQHPWDHVEGAPYGTRGGMVVNHVFPADGEYVFEVTFTGGDNARFEDIDISIDGERVALLAVRERSAGGRRRPRRDAAAAPSRCSSRPASTRSRPRSSSAADGPYEDLIQAARLVVRRRRFGRRRHHDAAARCATSSFAGRTRPPASPRRRAARRSSPAVRPRRRTSAPCARQIITRLGGEAYRRPLTTAEIDRLMPFYESGAAKGGFEAGVRAALEAILASPHFIFRLEKAPTDARSGGTYRVADIDLASRLSFFLWGAPPDQELLARRAAQGSCRPPPASRSRRAACSPIRAPTRSGRASPRSGCGCRTSTRSIPIRTSIPNFDENLADGDAHETELFFNNLVQRRPQPARSLSRRLHVRERAAGAALRHSRRRRRRVPPRHLSRRDAPRHPRPGQRCWCRRRSPTAPRRCCAASG